LHVGNVVNVLPTKIEAIITKECEVDFLFELENQTFLHLEFQTTYQESDFDRFMFYNSLLFEKHKKPIITSIIYGAEVLNAPVEKDYGSIHFKPKGIFMKDFNGDHVLHQIMAKVESKQELNQEELLQLMLLPLMKTNDTRSQRVLDAVSVAGQIPDKETKKNVLTMLAIFSAKFLNEEEMDTLIGGFQMVNVFEELGKRYMEQGKQAGIQEGLQKGLQEELQEGMEQKAKETCLAMLKKGMDIETIEEILGISKEKILEWKKAHLCE
jgi:predicted house-cleaning noncanonical NTP pyrophosphatase (MazG superfamily)